MEVDHRITGRLRLYYNAIRRLGYSAECAAINAANMGVSLGMMDPATREEIAREVSRPEAGDTNESPRP